MSAAIIRPAITASSGARFTAARLGPLAEVDRYELSVPMLRDAIRGKVFLKKALGLTGMEVSINKLPAGGAAPFLHRHRAHEELYVFTGGRGQMQVDGETFDVEEGSVVRVATGGARALRAAADEELRYLCIQAREGSMPDVEAAGDGERVAGSPRWP
jgi:mannose-6-phosphate isomerase-like protein (cupin superfamily)